MLEKAWAAAAAGEQMYTSNFVLFAIFRDLHDEIRIRFE